MKKLIYMFVAVMAAILSFSACSETEETDTEFDNWQERNDTYWVSVATMAKDSIADSQAAYGTAWRDSGNWQSFLTFSKDSTTAAGTDSIYVQRLRSAASADIATHTDSVRLRLRGRLIPSATYPEGYVFLNTGLYTSFEKVFDEASAGTAVYGMSALVRGLETALLYMKKGELWRVYVPYNLGYGSTAQSAIPAYSVLVFEVQLVEIYHAGESVTVLKSIRKE